MDETILSTEDGAILYDPGILNHMTPALMRPEAWPESEPVTAPAGGGGRGATAFVAGDSGRFVLRHYHRGGLAARLSDDRYLWTGRDRTRPFREWRLLARLYEAGLPVPRPAAASYRRRGASYSGDLLSVRLEGVRSLSALLAEGSPSTELWRGIGATIRRFHDAGVCHADLNAHNVQVAGDGKVYLLDFDRGRLRPPGRWRGANLARLRRSLEKVRRSGTGAAPVDQDWQALLSGYGA